jgi:hypothetical protein
MPRSGLNVSLGRVDLDGPRHDGPARDEWRHDLPRRSGAAHADDRRVNNGRSGVPFDYDSRDSDSRESDSRDFDSRDSGWRDSGWRDAGSRDLSWRYDPPHDHVQRDRYRPQNPRRTKTPATAIDPAASRRSGVPPARSSPSTPRSSSSPQVSRPPRAPRSAQPARAPAPDRARATKSGESGRPYNHVAPPARDRPVRPTTDRTNRRGIDLPAAPTTAGTDRGATDLPAWTTPGPTSRPPGPTTRPATDSSARRTIIIQGRGAERSRPSPTRRPHVRRRHERHGFRPDRAAMWAVLLGVVLVLVAATSSHAAVRTMASPKPRTEAAPAAHTTAPAAHTTAPAAHTTAPAAHPASPAAHTTAGAHPGVAGNAHAGAHRRHVDLAPASARCRWPRPVGEAAGEPAGRRASFACLQASERPMIGRLCLYV